MKTAARNNFPPLVTILCAGCLFLSACSTPAGKRAKRDATVIQRNDATARKAVVDAKDSNTRVSSLDSRIDSKDFVLEHAKIVP